MDAEDLSYYENAFDSEEISAADKFETDAVSFRNKFVDLKYDFIQPRYDLLSSIVFKIAYHYRPRVQACGCDCIAVLIAESAPSQIEFAADRFQALFDKLVQIGHNEVMGALLPAMTVHVDYVYKDPSAPPFSEFMFHFIETLYREQLEPPTVFTCIVHLKKLIAHAGLSFSRFVLPVLEFFERKLKSCSYVSHATEYYRCTLAMCEQCWPVIRGASKEIEKVLSIYECDDEKVSELRQTIRSVVLESPEEPQCWDS